MVFVYPGGGSGTGTSSGQISSMESEFEVTGVDPAESEATVTTTDLLTQEVDTTNVFQMAYEPDGDSIFGALLPNVYISHITLSPAGPDGSALDVNVDFVFKEKIEPDDVSLFAIDKITDALRLRIVMSTNKNITKYITNGGMSALNNQKVIYNQKKLASYLASNKLEQFSQENDNVQIHTVGLKEITQANGMISIPDNGDMANTFQSGLEKEILADGTQVYSTPYCAPSFIVEESAGGVDPNDLAIFAVTYVDFDAVLESVGVSSAQQFVNNKKDQFQALGYAPDTASMQTAAIQLETLFEDYGLGIPMKNQVIHHKKVQNFNEEFVYADGPKKGKVWGGIVHYHGALNPAPDGWIGYMGGASEHMGNASIPTPKLELVNISMPAQIVDLRPLSITDPPIEPTVQENPNPAPLFSAPYYSLHGDGQSSFMFSFDASQALMDNTANPEFLTSLKSGSPQKYASLLSQAAITNLSVSRQQMGTATDENGNPTLVPGGSEAHEIINVVYSSDVGGSLKTSANSLTTGTGVLGDGLSSADASNGNIQEVTLLSNNSGLRHFSITDSAIAKLNEGVFQYSVEIEMKDPVETLVSQVMSTVNNAKLEVEKYLDLIEAGGSKYYKSNGVLKKNFSDKYLKTAKTPSFQGTTLYKAVKAFFDNVVNELPVLKGKTKQQKSQLATIVLQQMNPVGGNKNNIEIGLQAIKNVETELLQITSHEPSSKDSTSALNTVESGLSSGAGKEKNIFKMNHSFSALFDTNTDATRGYEYVFPSNTASSKPTPAPGLASLSLDDYSSRMAIEQQSQGIPDSFTNFSESDPAASMPSYLSPLVVKVANKETNLNSGLDENQMQEVVVSVMTDNVDMGTLNIPNVKTSDPFMKPVSSPFSLFGPGVTVEPKGTARNGGSSDTSNSPTDIEEASSTNDSYETTISEDIITITPFLVKKLLLEKSGYFTNINFEDHLVFNLDGTLSTSNDIGSFLSVKKAFSGKGTMSYKQTLDTLPNHVKAVLDEISSPYIQTYSESGYKAASAEQQNLKEDFEQTPNLIKMLLAHRNLTKIEVMVGYDTTVTDGTQMVSPKFELLNSTKMQQLIDSASANTFVLARLRPYDDFGAFIQPSSMNLPVFNEHFLINLTPGATNLFDIEEEVPANKATITKVKKQETKMPGAAR
tara:strand:- start:13639 stop:17127 length:3489 start_codon:yes stop_codon:yes gene_type:complete